MFKTKKMKNLTKSSALMFIDQTFTSLRIKIDIYSENLLFRVNDEQKITIIQKNRQVLLDRLSRIEKECVLNLVKVLKLKNNFLQNELKREILMNKWIYFTDFGKLIILNHIFEDNFVPSLIEFIENSTQRETINNSKANNLRDMINFHYLVEQFNILDSELIIEIDLGKSIRNTQQLLFAYYNIQTINKLSLEDKLEPLKVLCLINCGLKNIEENSF